MPQTIYGKPTDVKHSVVHSAHYHQHGFNHQSRGHEHVRCQCSKVHCLLERKHNDGSCCSGNESSDDEGEDFDDDDGDDEEEEEEDDDEEEEEEEEEDNEDEEEEGKDTIDNEDDSEEEEDDEEDDEEEEEKEEEEQNGTNSEEDLCPNGAYSRYNDPGCAVRKAKKMCPGEPNPGELFSCNVCEKTFKMARQLAKHQVYKQHFGCSYCDTVFQTLQLLELHKESHQHWSDSEGDECRPEHNQLKSVKKLDQTEGVNCFTTRGYPMQHNSNEEVQLSLQDTTIVGLLAKASCYYNRNNIDTSQDQQTCKTNTKTVCKTVNKSKPLFTSSLGCKLMASVFNFSSSTVTAQNEPTGANTTFTEELERLLI